MMSNLTQIFLVHASFVVSELQQLWLQMTWNVNKCKYWQNFSYLGKQFVQDHRSLRLMPSVLREKQHTIVKSHRPHKSCSVIIMKRMKACQALCHVQEGKTATKFHYNTEPITSSKTICHNSFRLDLHSHFAFEIFRFIDFIHGLWSIDLHLMESVFSSRETWGQTHAAVMRGDDGENFTIKVSFQGGLWCLESALNI